MLVAMLAVLALGGCDNLFGSDDDNDVDVPQDVLEMAGGIFGLVGGVLQWYYFAPQDGVEVSENSDGGLSGWDITFSEFSIGRDQQPDLEYNGTVEIRITADDPFTLTINTLPGFTVEFIDDQELGVEDLELTLTVGWAPGAVLGHDPVTASGLITFVPYGPEPQQDTYAISAPDDIDNIPWWEVRVIVHEVAGSVLMFYGTSVTPADPPPLLGDEWELAFVSFTPPNEQFQVEGALIIELIEGPPGEVRAFSAGDGLALLGHHRYSSIQMDVTVSWDAEIQDEPDHVEGTFTVDNTTYDFGALFELVDVD
ncbi:MAG: hypothetical protein EA384_07150 [Spirochaetaceae bacterium]|nr:MAG: hypothetical protein EA384_07150 [Spirochaetaceae bacterium]